MEMSDNYAIEGINKSQYLTNNRSGVEIHRSTGNPPMILGEC
jgi:hypothetical protein